MFSNYSFPTKRDTFLIFTLILYLFATHTALANFQNRSSNKQQDEINILVISGYNPMIPWSQELTKGVAQAVREQAVTINVFFENVYGELSLSEEEQLNYLSSMEIQHQFRTFDVVVSDNMNGFQFLELMKDQSIFEEAKMVYFDELNRGNISGHIIDGKDFIVRNNTVQKQINDFFASNPNVKTIHLIDTQNDLQVIHLYEFQAYIRAEKLDVDIELWTNTSITNVKERAATLGNGDVFVYFPVFRNDDNIVMSPKAYLQTIAPSFDVPIYSFWNTFLGDGIVGGYLYSPSELGKLLIDSAVLLHQGKALPRDISSAKWQYDEEVLQRHGLSISKEAKDVELINPVSNIFTDYPIHIATAVIFTLLAFLAVFNSKNQKLRQSYQDSENAKAELKQALDDVQVLSEAKSKFLAIVSHEIRTPINGIMGALGLMHNESLTKQATKLVHTAESCSQTLLQMVNDILDFSKIESRNLSLQNAPFSLDRLVKDLTDYIDVCNQKSSVDINVATCDIENVWVNGDETRIRQVVVNLLNNAMKFTDDGMIKMTVTAREDTDTIHVNISVEDTGVGISEEQQAFLFTPFMQSHNHLQKSLIGTGLGLSICKELIELMDGTIQLDSEVGKGTAVTITLTLPKETPQIKETPDDQDKAVSLNSDLKILLVEDNATNREIIIAQLESKELSCDICEDGLACIEHLQQMESSYDLILMDIQMPRMDGFEATKNIRQGNAGMAHTNTPILAVTAHVSLEDNERFSEVGIDHVTHKPIRLNILLEDMRKALDIRLAN